MSDRPALSAGLTDDVGQGLDQKARETAQAILRVTLARQFGERRRQRATEP